MNADQTSKVDPSEETGVADVRTIRDKIAAKYDGDLRSHALETNRIVEPLIRKLGLKQGTPPQAPNRRSGTEG